MDELEIRKITKEREQLFNDGRDQQLFMRMLTEKFNKITFLSKGANNLCVKVLVWGAHDLSLV